MFYRHSCASACLGPLVLVWPLMLAAQESPATPKSKPSEPPAEASEGGDSTAKPFSGDPQGSAPTRPPLPSRDREGATTKQPTPDDIIRAFEQDRPVNTPVRPRGERENVDHSRRGSGLRTKPLLREGEYIHDLVGRLARDGAWWVLEPEFTDPDLPQPPMRLLPNQQLERLIIETKEMGLAQRPLFVISGEVTLFESHNFLLVRKTLRRRAPQNLEK